MDNNKPLTTLDTLVSPTNLLIMKALIPFMPDSAQKQFAVFIKMQELINTINLFNNGGLINCSGTSEPDMFRILDVIRVYFPEDISNTLDMMSGLFSMMSYFNGADMNMSDMMNMFGGDFMSQPENNDETSEDNKAPQTEENFSTEDIIDKLTDILSNDKDDTYNENGGNLDVDRLDEQS